MERRKRYPIIDGMKLCSKCKTVKPITEYSPGKNIKGEPIYRCHCKDCMRIYYTNKNRSKGVQPKKYYPIIDDHKECVRCNQVKPVDQFRKSNIYKSGIRGHCIECDLKENLQWRRAKGMVPKTFVAHPVIDGLKQCYICNKNLSVEQFSVNGRGHMGHSCKACNNKKDRPYRIKYYKRDSEELTDLYLTMVFNANSTKYERPRIHKKDIPQEVFEILRKKIKLDRELKQLKNQ